MFVLSNKPTYKFKVTVKRTSETGAWESVDFTAEFKRRTRPEIEAMIKGTEAKQGLPSDAEILATEFVGWSDIKQPDGSPLEVTDANRTVLLAEPFVQTAIVLAWLESAVKGPAKN